MAVKVTNRNTTFLLSTASFSKEDEDPTIKSVSDIFVTALPNTSCGDVDLIQFQISVSGLQCVVFFVRRIEKNTVFGACFRVYGMSCFLFFELNPR